MQRNITQNTHMQLLKSVISATLLVFSLSWLLVQRIIFPKESQRQTLAQQNISYADIERLKRDWCRVRQQRFLWQDVMAPCADERAYSNEMLDPKWATDPRQSKVSYIETQPAGEHTRILIDTYTSNGKLKYFGGDAWRVTVRGKYVMAATVIDLMNGTYEAISMIMEPGLYYVDIILDYTQCKGMRDPPTDWFVKAHCSGKRKNSSNLYLSKDTLANMAEYIAQPIGPSGSPLQLTVQQARYNVEDLPYITLGLQCGIPCRMLWDAYGRWTADGQTWIPYKPPEWKIRWTSLRKSAKRKDIPHSLLWIYGDSISYYFHQTIKNRPICTKIFKKCTNTYNWIYPKILYELRQTCDDIDLKVERVQAIFRNITTSMDENSVLLLNAGAHYVKNTAFSKYRETIDALIDVLQSEFRGLPIWRATTAIHVQNMVIMGAFRRYVTNQRTQLFNAYANAAMCSSGFPLLDTYPLTASYPFGTSDGVHYKKNVSMPIGLLLEDYFKAEMLQ